jgi:hypothetical protein
LGRIAVALKNRINVLNGVRAISRKRVKWVGEGINQSI